MMFQQKPAGKNPDGSGRPWVCRRSRVMPQAGDLTFLWAPVGKGKGNVLSGSPSEKPSAGDHHRREEP